jgi:hypothetical protein
VNSKSFQPILKSWILDRKGLDDGDLSLYQVLAHLAAKNSSNGGVQNWAGVVNRVSSKAMEISLANINSELKVLTSSSSLSDLSHYIKENQVVNKLFGEQEWVDTRDALRFNRNFNRRQTDSLALATTPAMVAFQNKVQHDLRTRDNLEADLYDNYFSAAQAGAWPIIGFWLAQRLMPPGLGSFLKVFSLSTRGAVNSYWIYFTASLATDAGTMVLSRAAGIKAEQALLTNLSQSQVSGEHIAPLDSYSYYQLMKYEDSYLSQTMSRAWWNGGVALFPFVVVWPAAKMMQGSLRPWHLARQESRLHSKLHNGQRGDILAEAFAARLSLRWQNYWQRQMKLYSFEFKALGMSEPSWNPHVLQQSYKNMKMLGGQEERLRAQVAYKNILELLAKEIWPLHEFPASRELMARALFGEKSRVELLDDVLIKYGELISAAQVH